MNTVFCIQQKAHRNQAFQKTENSNHMVSAYDGTKGRMPFFFYQKDKFFVVFAQKGQKRTHPQKYFGGDVLHEKRIIFLPAFCRSGLRTLERREKVLLVAERCQEKWYEAGLKAI